MTNFPEHISITFPQSPASISSNKTDRILKNQFTFKYVVS